MPKKISTSSLKELCLESVHLHLSTLQYAAKRLPLPLINDLYDKSAAHLKFGVRDIPPPLPADLFLHARTKTIYTLDFFNWPMDKIIEKISRDCKNLRKVYLKNNHGTDHIDHITAITMNNPNILMMDLSSSKCTNHHLLIIGMHCPQLEHLSLFNCDLISDEGMNYLPVKLNFLSVPQNVTHSGHLNTLERLPYLKELDPNWIWIEIIETYDKARANGFQNRTYQIEEIEIDLQDATSNTISDTVRVLFPKLHSVQLGYCTSTSKVACFLEGINYNFLRKISVSVPTDFIPILAWLCPTLEVLYISFPENQSISTQYLAKFDKSISFKCLWKLDIDDPHSKLTTNDFELLLADCLQLEDLTIVRFNQFSDELIYNLLRKNPLKFVKSIFLNICEPFSIESLCVLLKSLDSLLHVSICYCRQLALADKDIVEKLIADMKWDLELTWY